MLVDGDAARREVAPPSAAKHPASHVSRKSMHDSARCNGLFLLAARINKTIIAEVTSLGGLQRRQVRPAQGGADTTTTGGRCKSPPPPPAARSTASRRPRSFQRTPSYNICATLQKGAVINARPYNTISRHNPMIK